MNGVMVFYIDVGQLSPFKAEAMVERWKDNCKNTILKLETQGIETMFIPVRPGSLTRVEFMPTSKEGAKFKVENVKIEETEEELIKTRIRKLEELKLQVMAQNPSLVGVVLPGEK